MAGSDEHDETDLTRRADALAVRLDDENGSFATAAPQCAAEYRDLLAAVVRRHPAYAFDRDGRPGAIAAVREALPSAERELFDAIVDDCACEVAAVEEALYQVIVATRRRQG